MKFVVTGGAGFIGSHIVKHLLNKKNQVTVIDNFSKGRLENLTGFEEQIDLQKLDILDFNSLKNTISDSDGVFHQAALTSVPESFIQKEKYHSVNVTGTENIFKIAKEYSIKVVYASSSSVYGDTTSIPIQENFERKPINPYGITKLDDEKLAEKYHDLGVAIIGLRYFNVYGIGQTSDYAGVITKFHNNIQANNPPIILGDGSQVRDFISVEDVAKANLLSMQSATDFSFLNIGTGIPTSIKDPPPSLGLKKRLEGSSSFWSPTLACNICGWPINPSFIICCTLRIWGRNRVHMASIKKRPFSLAT